MHPNGHHGQRQVPVSWICAASQKQVTTVCISFYTIYGRKISQMFLTWFVCFAVGLYPFSTRSLYNVPYVFKFSLKEVVICLKILVLEIFRTRLSPVVCSVAQWKGLQSISRLRALSHIHCLGWTFGLSPFPDQTVALWSDKKRWSKLNSTCLFVKARLAIVRSLTFGPHAERLSGQKTP